MEVVKSTDGQLLQVDLECKIEDIQNAEEYAGLEFVSSKDIGGVPGKPELLNPTEVIEEGNLKDFSLEENKKFELPAFNATSINTTVSEKTGTFVINGEFSTDLESKLPINFEIMLAKGQKTLCILPEIPCKSKVEIEHEPLEELTNQKVIIQELIASVYDEIFLFNEIVSEEEVSISNGKEIKLIAGAWKIHPGTFNN